MSSEPLIDLSTKDEIALAATIFVLNFSSKGNLAKDKFSNEVLRNLCARLVDFVKV